MATHVSHGVLPLAVVGPLAKEMVSTLELSRAALDRVPLQPWGDFEGPSIESIVARIDRVLALHRDVQDELRVTKSAGA